MLYERVAGLDLRIDEYDLGLRRRDTSSGFERVTTVIEFKGGGEIGRGEDVTYDGDANRRFATEPPALPIPHEGTFESFSRRLSDIDLFETEPEQSAFRSYRRWAVESAALDLALRQTGASLAERLDRKYNPVRFVVSTRLEEPPTGEKVLTWLDRKPDLEFKLDPTTAWTEETVARLAGTGAIRVLDLKGQYEGTDVDQPADPALYRRVLKGFPQALIEDPALTEETRPLFEKEHGRVTWDYPIGSVADIGALPWAPETLNIKPSRFGTVRSLFEAIEYCLDHEIRMYGGGQFELDVGREHLHVLASLFYPESPNDVAPTGYNDPDPSDKLPDSPLASPTEPVGLSWGMTRES